MGVILPKELIARLNLDEGGTLYVSETPDGGLRLTAADPRFAEQMQAAESIIQRYRNTLKELAK